VASGCRRVEAVQGARIRRGRRTGAGLAGLRCGDSLFLLLALLFSSTSSLFSSFGASAAEGAEHNEGARVLGGGLEGS
jgi:hypothetical protein